MIKFHPEMAILGRLCKDRISEISNLFLLSFVHSLVRFYSNVRFGEAMLLHAAFFQIPFAWLSSKNENSHDQKEISAREGQM